MKSIQKLSLLLGITGLCLTASAANVAGRFTLPEQAYWGSAVLEPGDYTFTLEETTGAQERITLRQGTKGVALILAADYSTASSSDHSSLLIVEHRVRSLHLAAAGVTYYFPGHKNASEFASNRHVDPGIAIVPVSVK